MLGGDHTPRPSDWNRLPHNQAKDSIWFFGQHRNPSTTTWQADALVGHSYDIYENGTLSIVRYDDTGGDRDFNDFVLEVAIVGRQSWADLVQAIDQVSVNKKIEKEGLPKLLWLLKKRKK